MALDKGPSLVCHTHRTLVPFEVHHLMPSGYGGPDTPENRVKICANAHSAIHHLMERMLRGKPYNLRDYGPKVRKMAIFGYLAVMIHAEEMAEDAMRMRGLTDG